MLRKKNARKITDFKNMFNGSGIFHQQHVLTKEEMEDHGRLFADCNLSVGGCVGGHVHHGDCEVCYFLSGKGRVTDDEAVYEVEAGDTNFVKDGHYHKIENIGDEELRYIALILYTPKDA